MNAIGMEKYEFLCIISAVDVLHYSFIITGGMLKVCCRVNNK